MCHLKRFVMVCSILSCLAFLNPAHAATVTGTITFDGAAPKLKPLKMDADPVCLTHHTGEVLPQTIELGEGNNMANVFVHVKSGLPKTDYPAPAEEVVITQKGCIYTPHVLGVRVGQTVKILNPDGTLHNVHALSKANPEFNLAMPKFRTEVTRVFDKAEFMFPLKCDVHPWMGAWLAVMPHPYFATTGKDGKFSIPGLPAGTYEIEAWHEKLGTQKMSLAVGGDETKELTLTFAAPAAPGAAK